MDIRTISGERVDLEHSVLILEILIATTYHTDSE
jgi:hypothetical protein